MKWRSLSGCLLAAVLAVGMASAAGVVFARTEGPPESEQQEIIQQITDEKTEYHYIWDRNSQEGIRIDWLTDSDEAVLLKNSSTLSVIFSENDPESEGKCFYIDVSVLITLEIGDHTLTLVSGERTVTIHLTVTDSESSQEASQDSSEVIREEPFYSWERGSDTGIVIETDSESKHFYVKKDGVFFTASLICQSLSIEDGQIRMDPGFLEKLENGENRLTLVLKEGSQDITVFVDGTSPESSGEEKELSAEETYFTWDRSNYIGIAVITDSRSGDVVITKDGEELFSSDETGVYLTFGRVGITAKHLRKLDDGENELMLEFEDGRVPITVNVTDEINTSDSDQDIVADQTVYTWKRNSKKSIRVRTNSVSENVSVRKSGRLSTVSGENNISIKEGTVTIETEYLKTLSDGTNELSLIFDDGKTNIVVNVEESQTSQSSSSAFSALMSDTVRSSASSSEESYSVPDTGSPTESAGFWGAAGIAAIAGAFSLMIVSGRKRKTIRLNDKEQ